MTKLQKPDDDDTTQPIPCVIYAAKSTEDKRGSIRTQLEDGRAMAEREGWEIVGEFWDEGFSAYSGNRGRGLEQAKACASTTAEERGRVTMLAAQHSDRLARGAGDEPGAADSLGEIWHSLRRRNVHLRSVQNDFELSDPVLVAVAGKRDHEDSKRKSANVAKGLRRVAEGGEWAGGILADGYRAHYWHEDGGERRRVEYDPDRKEVWDVVWALALDHYSAHAIVLELDRQGFVTAPKKKGHKPRPFDSNRIRLALNNPFYAGLVAQKGEVIGNGNWPRYIDPEDFYRLKAERNLRGNVEQRRPGRPVEGALLAGLARCSCGAPMDTVAIPARINGERPKRYSCRTHRDRPQDCTAKPIDAAVADAAMLENLPAILHDGDLLTRAASAARDAQRGKLETVARLADEESKAAAAAAERLAARVASLYADGEDARAEGLEAALARAIRDRKEARARGDAALDALSVSPDQLPGEGSWDALREQLLTRVDGAGGSGKRLNLALREFIQSVTLRVRNGNVLMLSTQLRPETVARVLANVSLAELQLEHIAPEGRAEALEITIVASTENSPPPW